MKIIPPRKDFNLPVCDEDLENDNNAPMLPNQGSNLPVLWGVPLSLFRPGFFITKETEAILLAPISRNSTELEVFKCIFPESLFIFNTQSTNERMALVKVKGQRNLAPTEIKRNKNFVGNSVYNRLPEISDYWPQNESMGNEFIKRAIARNRYQNLMSKLYFIFLSNRNRHLNFII